jgi:SAM-dependent methyltransferase
MPAKMTDTDCPVCRRLGKATALVSADNCPSCGSLEGLDLARDLPEPSGSVGHDWKGGSVAPWRTRDGAETYATPRDVAAAALTAAGLRPFVGGDQALAPEGKRQLAVVIDLGCGDGQIVRTAAALFGSRGLGLDIDDGALAEARERGCAEGLEHLVAVRAEDFTKVDLAAEVRAVRLAALSEGPSSLDHNADASAGADAIDRVTVVVAAFLLPDALERLRPRLEEAVGAAGAVVVTFRWDMGARWSGPRAGEKDAAHGFTVYRPHPRALA